MFEVQNIPNNIVKFVFIDPFTTEDMKKVLALIKSLLEKEKLFAFYVDSSNANNPPTEAASLLLKWMRSNRESCKKYLICSCVVIKNSATNIIIKKLLTGVFTIQPTAAPNLITVDQNAGMKWVNDKIQARIKE